MTTALWIAQATLVFVFLPAGAIKQLRPKAELREQMGWVEDFSQGTIRMIGVAEILGAFGVILPMALGILPALTPIAAAGLAALMLGAAGTHVRRHEWAYVGLTSFFAAVAVFVAAGRWELLVG